MSPDDFPEVIGQDAAILKIPDPLPPTLLIKGPAGVGKRTFALALGRSLSKPPDLLTASGRMTVETAQEIVEHHRTEGQHPRVSVADLTLPVSREAFMRMMKLVEELPEQHHLIFYADVGIKLLKRRCFTVIFSLLDLADVETVLAALKVPNPHEAAQASRGSVRYGIQYAFNYEAREAANRIFAVFSRQDPAQLEFVLHDVVHGTSEEFREALCVEFNRGLWAGLIEVPVEVQSRAAAILQGASRPAIRLRAATWVLAGA